MCQVLIVFRCCVDVVRSAHEMCADVVCTLCGRFAVIRPASRHILQGIIIKTRLKYFSQLVRIFDYFRQSYVLVKMNRVIRVPSETAALHL